MPSLTKERGTGLVNENQIKELTETTSRSKSNTHRIDKLEEQQNLLHEMNSNIAAIAEQTKYTKEEVSDLKKDVEEIKMKPSKLLDGVKENALGVIVGAIVGAIIALVL
jgi:predicted nuclease with TOPRIM domain